MHLWDGSIRDFVQAASANSLAGALVTAYYNHHRNAPSPGETASWEHSLKSLAEALRPMAALPLYVVVEYHMPYSFCRIDVILLGRNAESEPSALLIEIKQWSSESIKAIEGSKNLRVAGREHQHPSEQALGYLRHLQQIHSGVVSGAVKLAACAYLHNLSRSEADALLSEKFDDTLFLSPIYFADESEIFRTAIETAIGHGEGDRAFEELVGGRFLPAPTLLSILDEVISGNTSWQLLDEQRVAYNAVWAQVIKAKSAHKNAGRHAIIVRGAPGTGKTVVAIQLLADALRSGFTAAHATGGKAFTTALRATFSGAESIFIWNLNTRNSPPQDLDLLLVDEAHRVRATSDTRFTPKAERGKRSQIEELMAASKVVVFLLDENQFVRPDEVGASQAIKDTANKLGIEVVEFDLVEQFRCGGCVDYLNWIDRLLGFSNEPVNFWGGRYQLQIVGSIEDLEQRVRGAIDSGERARIVGGFCWEWSNALSDGSLVNDVRIGNWERPWNRKPIESRQYRPKEHPYTLWANTSEGEFQVGCIYSAQGFEFDTVGVIWGEDLVWRDGNWVAQRDKTHDKPVRAKSADTLRLLKNAYRVLLTRGIKRTVVLFLDKETEQHFRSQAATLASA
jgi:hypothetical protein